MFCKLFEGKGLESETDLVGEMVEVIDGSNSRNEKRIVKRCGLIDVLVSELQSTSRQCEECPLLDAPGQASVEDLSHHVYGNFAMLLNNILQLSLGFHIFDDRSVLHLSDDHRSRWGLAFSADEGGSIRILAIALI